MRRLLALALLGLSPALLVAQEHPHAAPHWSYAGDTGPRHWGDLESDYAAGSFVRIEGHRYQLVQFHFHHPSEEKVDGRAYDMVAHLVHKDAEGHLAVVAVLLTKGQANPLVQTLWDHLPGQVGHEDTVPSLRVNAADLLPKHLGYFEFEGSLTTPPCTEGVRWMVMREPTAISPSEIATFGKLYHDNARPTQPSNGRAVKEST